MHCSTPCCYSSSLLLNLHFFKRLIVLVLISGVMDPWQPNFAAMLSNVLGSQYTNSIAISVKVIFLTFELEKLWFFGSIVRSNNFSKNAESLNSRDVKNKNLRYEPSSSSGYEKPLKLLVYLLIVKFEKIDLVLYTRFTDFFNVVIFSVWWEFLTLIAVVMNHFSHLIAVVINYIK